MKKLCCLLTLGFISLIYPQAAYSLLVAGVEALQIAEENRQNALQNGYNHLPNTYDIFQRLTKINPRLRANEVEKEIIARSVIKNALLINNFNILIKHYIVRDDAMITHRMTYLAISAIALSPTESFKYARNWQHNKKALFENLVSKFYSFTMSLYLSVIDDLANRQQEADPKEYKHDLEAFAASLSAEPISSKPRPKQQWHYYPKFYQDILKKIQQKTKLTDANADIIEKRLIVAYAVAISQPLDDYSKDKGFPYCLLGGLQEFGLSHTNMDTLMHMFSLVVPEAPQRWVQIKEKGAQGISKLKENFTKELAKLYRKGLALQRKEQEKPFLLLVSEMYYTYIWLDEDELIVLLNTGEIDGQTTLAISQQINIISQNLIFHYTHRYFEHTGKLKELFPLPESFI